MDVMREVGQGKCYLSNVHTARNYRNALHRWDVEKLALESTLSDRMMPRMRDAARMILCDHTVIPLEDDVLREGERILTDCSKSAV